METSQQKRSLLQKYDIPINHLDFEYIKKCSNSKEIERILLILKSGQEGFYPDLTQCAENRLKTLNPTSKALRQEVPLLTRAGMKNSEWQDISGNVYDWEAEIKEKHKCLRQLATDAKNPNIIPPVRQSALVANENENPVPKKKIERVKACNYEQWDKYDPDTEILKMDLTEERIREEVSLKNKKNAQRPLIEVLDEPLYLKGLNTVEREELANKHRIKGNECFKAQDYRDAIDEYTYSISANRTAVAFNNRAMAYLKLNENKKAIDDCNDCLALDRTNLKAYMRKGQALLDENQFTEAFGVYTKILELYPDNAGAKNQLMEIRQQKPDLPPPTAVRMKIQEASIEEIPRPCHKSIAAVSETKPPMKSNACPARGTEKKLEQADDDFAKLIIPKKIVPSRFAKIASAMGANMSKAGKNQANQKAVSNEKAQRTIMRNGTPKIVMSKNNLTTYDNGVVIEEL